MNKRSLARALSAAVTAAVVATGTLVGTSTSAGGAPDRPQQQGVLQCVLNSDLADCVTVDCGLTGTGVAGEQLTVTDPVFGLLSVVQQAAVVTTHTWLCDGAPIAGGGDVLAYTPTDTDVGCDISVHTVSSLLGFLPLTQVTNAVTIIPSDQRPPLPPSLNDVLTAPTLLDLLPLTQRTDPVEVSRARTTTKLTKLRGKKVKVKVGPASAHPTGKVRLKERKKT